MKKNVVIAAVLAAVLSLASCSDISIPVQEDAAAATTSSPVVSAPAETAQTEAVAEHDSASESTPADTESKETAVTTVSSAKSSSDPVQEEREKLKNTTITANVPVTTKSPSNISENADDTSSQQTDASSDDYYGRDFAELQRWANTALENLNEIERVESGQYSATWFCYDSDFNLVDEGQPFAYYGVLYGYEDKCRSASGDAWTFFSEDFISGMGYDSMDNERFVTDLNNNMYFIADYYRESYLVFQRADSDINMVDADTFFIYVEEFDKNGNDLGRYKMVFKYQGDRRGYYAQWRLDSLTAV